MAFRPEPWSKISHRISYGIIETALEEQCNLIVMGRARRVGLLERFAATVVDRVVRSAPAQVLTVTAERWPPADQEDPLRLRARAALRIGGGPGGRLWPGGASRGAGRSRAAAHGDRQPRCSTPRKR